MERKTMQVSVRMGPALMGKIDEWRKDVEDLPSRPEAMRRLVRLGMLKEPWIKAAAELEAEGRLK